jgi:hypothetical protein
MQLTRCLTGANTINPFGRFHATILFFDFALSSVVLAGQLGRAKLLVWALLQLLQSCVYRPKLSASKYSHEIASANRKRSPQTLAKGAGGAS